MLYRGGLRVSGPVKEAGGNLSFLLELPRFYPYYTINNIMDNSYKVLAKKYGVIEALSNRKTDFINDVTVNKAQ